MAGIRAGQLGLKTALIEKDDKFGGTCLHVGCIPTKAMLLNADVYDYFKNSNEFGITCKEFSVDWAAVQERKNKIVTKNAKGVEFLLKKNKVETLQGYGSWAGPGRVTRERLEGRGARNHRQKHCPGHGLRSKNDSGPGDRCQDNSDQQRNSEPERNPSRW